MLLIIIVALIYLLIVLFTLVNAVHVIRVRVIGAVSVDDPLLHLDILFGARASKHPATQYSTQEGDFSLWLLSSACLLQSIRDSINVVIACHLGSCLVGHRDT